MSHILDRPIWSALATRHAALAEGGEMARRYPPSIAPFAATRDDTQDSLEALGALAGLDESLLFLQADEVFLPPGYAATTTAAGVQMMAERHMPKLNDERVVLLDQADAEDMLALATLTRPGPFTLRAQSLGSFWGVKEDGRLVAMAGERMKQPGFTELSGVAVHPDWQGRGLGRLMSLFAVGKIFAKGEQPYLHAYASNSSAIALYETLGFKLRRRMNVVVAKRA